MNVLSALLSVSPLRTCEGAALLNCADSPCDIGEEAAIRRVNANCYLYNKEIIIFVLMRKNDKQNCEAFHVLKYI